VLVDRVNWTVVGAPVRDRVLGNEVGAIVCDTVSVRIDERDMLVMGVCVCIDDTLAFVDGDINSIAILVLGLRVKTDDRVPPDTVCNGLAVTDCNGLADTTGDAVIDCIGLAVITDADCNGLAVTDCNGLAVTDCNGLAVTDCNGLVVTMDDGLAVTDCNGLADGDTTDDAVCNGLVVTDCNGLAVMTDALTVNVLV